MDRRRSTGGLALVKTDTRIDRAGKEGVYAIMAIPGRNEAGGDTQEMRLGLGAVGPWWAGKDRFVGCGGGVGESTTAKVGTGRRTR